MLAFATGLVDCVSWMVSLFSEVADNDLNVLLVGMDVTMSWDFFDQVSVSATNLARFSPSDLSVDVGFLGSHLEFVDEGSIDLIVATEESGEGSLVVESLEGTISGHTEDDF